MDSIPKPHYTVPIVYSNQDFDEKSARRRVLMDHGLTWEAAGDRAAAEHDAAYDRYFKAGRP